MAYPLTIVAVIGSLRRESWTRRLAQSFIGLAPSSMQIALLEIGELPLYNQDDEEAPPAAWSAFRKRVAAANAVLFVTPEYNRSIPGGLKNAIDVGSRPNGQSVWAGKPAAVVSASPGALGGFGAHHHLRQCIVALDMPTMAQPEAYASRVDKLFDATGAIAEARTRDFHAGFLRAFESWARQVAPPSPGEQP